MPRPGTRDDVVAAVRALPDPARDGVRWVGIDGFGAAGKSTLADALAVADPRVTVVRVDDFWGPSIAEWDWDRFTAQVVTPLSEGRPARYQVWDWDADTGGEWVVVPPGRVLVVEGVSSTRAEVPVRWDLTVWVETPRDVRLERAVDRDGEAMLPRWLEDWMPSEEAYAARERPWDRVELVVAGAGQDGPGTGAPQVRLAGPDDVAAVLAFGEEHVRAHYAPLIGADAADAQVRTWWTAERMTVASREGRVVVADVDGRVVGVAEWGRHGDDVVVWKLYAHPDHRGSGLGPRLIDAVVRSLPAGTPRLLIEHVAANERAAAFYAREGFTVDRVDPSTTGDPGRATVWRSRAIDPAPPADAGYWEAP